MLSNENIDLDKDGYGNMQVNVSELYAQYPPENREDVSDDWLKDPFHKVYRTSWLPLRARNYAWHWWRRTGLDQSWFEVFQRYWSQVLGGRPLWGPEDLYFLRSWYRLKFQQSNVPGAAGAEQHLSAWQQPEVLYQLLHLVYKESRANELALLNLMGQVAPRWPAKSLEFGCGTAPITTTLLEFWPKSRQGLIFISDIATLAFHFGAYKLGCNQNVFPLVLDPADEFQLKTEGKVEVIYCMTVFEHLNRPLDTVKRMHEALEDNGILVFDYILGEGAGLDTIQGVQERKDVLGYIADNFHVRYGKLDTEKSMGKTIVSKK